ncbi:alkaline phosphatase D family protein [Herpetosiphon giganteus]|uniref:alkaline phosphatase D family protein n=1 Tax=Herpetosiphon giganteus TaxID=2029754 RepID=UPI00195B9427|nr:alkaline phosphatase D family protein [Herpetosiphon giganteus]MBM7844002.1 3-phytase/alkaline phosphatase D [Herpetosiphon giganteus]
MRRIFGLCCLGCLLVGSWSSSPSDGRINQTLPPADLPQGIAVGDVTTTSAVLWARAASLGTVNFEYSLNPDFNPIIGLVPVVVSDPMLPAKASISNLQPATNYFYRATTLNNASVSGKFRTAPALGSYSNLRFGASGDQQGALAPFPALANADQRRLDLFIHLGDSIYADIGSPVLGTTAKTLAEFRLKHTESYSTRLNLNSLADLRATTAWLATTDDHEVANDHAGGANPSSDPRFLPSNASYINDTAYFEAGYQAFVEYNPLNEQFYGATGDQRTANERKLYRYQRYGNTAAFFVLDGRSFRDQKLTAPNNTQAQIAAFLTAVFSPTRTLLGQAQLEQLETDLLAAQQAKITWKFVVVPEPIQNLGIAAANDRFEGYAAERTRILSFINQHAIENVVFIAADIHGTVVNNLSYQTAANQPQIATNAWEISVGSVATSSPYGARVASAALATGIISQTTYNNYLQLPNPQQDAMAEGWLNTSLNLFGYTPVGLDDAPFAERTRLLQGRYLAGHYFGWTEFGISLPSQTLLVSTYGIDTYGTSELANNPNEVVSRVPVIVQQFTVEPVLSVTPTLMLTHLPVVTKN